MAVGERERHEYLKVDVIVIHYQDMEIVLGFLFRQWWRGRRLRSPNVR